VTRIGGQLVAPTYDYGIGHKPALVG
jgi:hypothetical protein